MSRSTLWSWLVLAFFPLAACRSSSAAPAKHEEARHVTVAAPVVESFTETADYVATTESPARVEVRSRVSGEIVRAAFAEGDIVQKGALLYVIDPRPFEVALARAQAELASVKADHVLAVQMLERANTLLKSGVVPQQEWETRTASAAQLAARVQVAEAAVRAAQLDLEYAHVRSPITGRVGRKLVTEGNLVGPSTPQPLTTVMSVDPLYVYFDVEEGRSLELARQAGLVARIAFGTKGEVVRSAPVDFVDNHVDVHSGTLKFRAVVKNADGRLTDGLYARVELPVEKERPSLLVADQAIATDQDRRFVWVVDSSNRAAYRPVKLGPLFDGLRVVKEGLHEGDRVIVRGLQRPHAGDLVEGEEISMKDVAAGIEKRAER